MRVNQHKILSVLNHLKKAVIRAGLMMLIAQYLMINSQRPSQVISGVNALRCRINHSLPETGHCYSCGDVVSGAP